VTKAIVGNGLFTSVRPDVRRIVPEARPGVPVVKVVYVVLEAQYQSALSAAVRSINKLRKEVTFTAASKPGQFCLVLHGRNPLMCFLISFLIVYAASVDGSSCWTI
jgi:hypothetical protein